MSSNSRWVKRYPLLAFLILAYGLSWMVEIPLALSAQGVVHADIPFALHYLAGYGPMLSALIVTGLTGGAHGLRALGGSMIKWKVKPGWWLVAVSPLGLYLLVAAALWMIQGERIDLAVVGQVDFLPALGLATLPMWILTFGIGEETGWRGFALPRLREGRNALSATIILWMFWSLWHLPMFFYSYEVAIVPGMLTGLLAGAIIFTWLYDSTGGSILLLALWHGTFNFVTGCSACKSGPIAPIVSIAVMVWAGVLVIYYQKPRSHGAGDQTRQTTI